MLSKTIFFSWQSDLPAGVTRVLIEKAIEQVLTARKNVSVHLNENVDRDTMNTSGSPDIVDSVFKKIDSCSVFVADISLINEQSAAKRTPNPNVLVELGYAIKTVGWENIILVFNEAYGDIKDVPFDLRQRRTLKYTALSGEVKQQAQDKLSTEIAQIISDMLDRQLPSDTIKTNIKLEIDKQIMKIGNHIYKLLYGFSEFISPDDVLDLLDLDTEQISKLASSQKVMGFQVLKSWAEYAGKLDLIKDNVVYSRYMDEAKVSAIIELNNALGIAEGNFMAGRFYAKTLARGKAVKTQGYQLEGSRTEGHYTLATKSNTTVDTGYFHSSDKKDLLFQYTMVEDELFVLLLALNGVLEGMAAVVSSWENFILADPATTLFI